LLIPTSAKEAPLLFGVKSILHREGYITPRHFGVDIAQAGG